MHAEKRIDPEKLDMHDGAFSLLDKPEFAMAFKYMMFVSHCVLRICWVFDQSGHGRGIVL